MALTLAQQTDAYRFFSIAFDAVPGVTFMNQIAEAYGNGSSTLEVVEQFVSKSQFVTKYPLFLTNEDFASSLIENVVGASADAAAKTEAKADVVASLNSGSSRGLVIFTIFNNLANKAADDAVWGNTAKQMANQVAVAKYVTETLRLDTTDLVTLAKPLANVTEATDVSTPAALEAATSSVVSGQAFTLTAGADSITGTSGNDTINAVLSSTAANNTLGGLDIINGGAGTDTLTILDETGGQTAPATLQLSGVETVNVRSAGATTVDLTANAGITDVTSLNATQSAAVTLKAATTTDINVSGATGAIIVDGGKNVTVTDATAAAAITIGATTVGAGTVIVTDTKVGAADINVDGGTDVTIAATGSTGGANVITVGQGGVATDLPSGAVSVSSAHTGVAATDVTLNAITVSGGSTVTVTQTSDTSKAAADTTGATLTQGAVTVTAGTATTSVTVNQAKSTTEVVGVTAVAGTTETASVKFGVLKSGDVLAVAGLTFTASADMTAAQVAAAFANLINGTVPATGDTQSGGAAATGTYTFNTSGWTSGAVSTDTVVFTSTTPNSNVADLTPFLTNTSGSSVAPVVTTTAGASATAAKTGVLGVITGAVTIDDNATVASVKTISIDGYDTTGIGATKNVSALETLSLANSGGATAGLTNAAVTANVGATLATLNLGLNNVQGAVTLTGAGLKTVNVTATGANSTSALSAVAAETLTIAGDKLVNLATGTFTALKTLTVSGAAGAVFDGDEADTLTSVNTSATTGAVTATIDGTKATYTGGAGVDTVTLATGTALTKAIDLGAGDDTLSFAALAVTGSTAAVAGGTGTDTLSMSTATAAALDATPVTFYSGFERLTLNDAGAAATIDLANLGFTNYVTTSGSAGTLTLDKLASNGTVVLTVAPTTGVTVQVADAATGTADVLNLVLSSSANLAAGLLTAADVETVNISTVDTEAAPQIKNVDSLTLTADKATAVSITGGQDLTLTLTGSTKVTSIDGSAMTGKLTVTSLNTTDATTITGGSANDTLTAAVGNTADVLLGGAGDDTLVANAGLTTLTGGAGNDVFTIGTASLNVNSYATVTDFAAGDLLQLTGIDSFASAKVTLGGTAVFQDFANAAINALTTVNDAGWFQFGGDTYVVADIGNTTAFVNGTDFIVKLTGLVDLTNASFNDTSDTIAL